MGAGSDLLKEQIIDAAVARHCAQEQLERGAQAGHPSHFMRQRQRAVNQADRRLADLTAEFIKTFGRNEQLMPDSPKK